MKNKNKNIKLTFTLLTLLLIPGLFLSCTQEGAGIFEQVVSQGASSSYRIKQFLGNSTDSSTETFYFIEENGLYANNRKLVNGNFSSGYKNGNNIYLFNNNDARIYLYNIDTNMYSAFSLEGNALRTFNQITDSGFAIETNKDSYSNVKVVSVWDLKTGSKVSEISDSVLEKYASCLSSEDSILIEVYNKPGEIALNSYYLYDRIVGNCIQVKNLTGMGIGVFQKASDNFYYIVFTRTDSSAYSHLYRIERADSSLTAKLSTNKLNYLLRDTSQSPSLFTTSSNFSSGAIIIRSSSKYEQITNVFGKSQTYTEKDSGYASGIYISDMELVNIKKMEGSNDTFIFAFYKYGLFKVNPSAGTTPVQIDWK